MSSEVSRVAMAVATWTALSLCGSCGGLSPSQIDSMQRHCSEKPYRPDRVASNSIAFHANGRPAGTPVVIYGASWCPACDMTAAYLTRRHIPFVDKDIEVDKGAGDEMLATLTTAGLRPTTSLPVVDVRGTVTIGFFPCVLEAAWAVP